MPSPRPSPSPGPRTAWPRSSARGSRSGPGGSAAAAPPRPAAAAPCPRPHRSRSNMTREPRRSSTGYLGALWIIAPLMPGLAAVVTVGTYLFLPTLTGVEPPTPPAYPAWALIAGLGVTALVWFGGAFFAKALVSAPRAQLRLYAELLERTRSLRDRTSTVRPSRPRTARPPRRRAPTSPTPPRSSRARVPARPCAGRSRAAT